AGGSRRGDGNESPDCREVPQRGPQHLGRTFEGRMTMDSEQISWLTLERFWLGELGPAEKARVERALEQSEELRRCLERIRSDVGRPLPPLPVVRAPVSKRRERWWWFEGWPGLLAATAGIVAIVGVWSIWNRTGDRSVRSKGDAAVLELVRESGGV